MSFRVEEKFRISKNKLLLFKKWLNANNAEKIFPDRKIISIYLDNEEKIGESMKEYAAQYNDPEIRGNALIASIYNTGGTYEIYVEFDIPCPNNLGPQYLGMAEIKIVNWELEILSRSASMVHCENYTQ